MAIYNLTGLHRLTAHHRRHTRRTETEAVSDRHVIILPSLDRTAWRMWGLFPACDGAVIEAALHSRADQLPQAPEGVSQTRGQRHADALTAICHDSLESESDNKAAPVGSGGTVTLVCDARDATPSNGETGVTVVGGPRVGPHALEAVLCDGVVDLIALTSDGTPLGVGQTTSTLPPKIRRYVLARDQACTIDGCQSRYRLQPHHIQHRAWGGDHDTHNLTTLCWRHHHRIRSCAATANLTPSVSGIHGYGYRIDPNSPTHRRRLIPPGAESSSCAATANLTPNGSGIDPNSPPMRRRLKPPATGPP
jgi:hypothetical protein